MKLFYSWQSDRHEKTGRYFIQDVLEQAISDLKKDLEIEVAARLDLDQDTKGVPGSPNVAETILAKIRQCVVFIADVTPVGLSADGKKELTNPNVAIELGYALSVVGEARLIMVLNEAYGTREGLPFDLRHKRGPCEYNLAADADSATIRAAKKPLCGILKSAIRTIVETNPPHPANDAERIKQERLLAKEKRLHPPELPLMPADFKKWDHIDHLAVWQAACLWEGLAPDLNVATWFVSPAYPFYTMLLRDIEYGNITPTRPYDDICYAQLAREDLIKLAKKKGTKPAFLFPRVRKKKDAKQR